MEYRKRPVVVDAVQWNGKFTGEVIRLADERLCDICGKPHYEHGWIKTLEGGHIVCPGDWIITGVKGGKYPCKPDIFALTYEPVLTSKAGVEELKLAIAKRLRLFDECATPYSVEEKQVDIDKLWEESKDKQEPYLLWAEKFTSVLMKNIGKLLADDEAVDKVAKWLNSVSENGDPYDEVENMAWSELAGGEQFADAFRELAADLLNNYLPMALGVAERVKKHPPEKRASSGRGKS